MINSRYLIKYILHIESIKELKYIKNQNPNSSIIALILFLEETELESTNIGEWELKISSFWDSYLESSESSLWSIELY